MLTSLSKKLEWQSMKCFKSLNTQSLSRTYRVHFGNWVGIKVNKAFVELTRNIVGIGHYETHERIFLRSGWAEYGSSITWIDENMKSDFKTWFNEMHIFTCSLINTLLISFAWIIAIHRIDIMTIFFDMCFCKKSF